MGAGGSKKGAHQPEVNQQEKQMQQLTTYIQGVFQKASVNGVLTKDKFNQALAVLQGADFKRLRDTPLAERLFFLLDKNKDGIIDQKDFSQGLNQILLDKNNAIMYSFKAFDADEDNRISKRQFVLFIEQSWKSAFRILGENIQKNRSDLRLSLGDITNWATSQVSTLNDKTTNLFNTLDINRTGFIEFIAFKEWMTTGNMNSIKAELEGVQIEVPIHYIKMKK